MRHHSPHSSELSVSRPQTPDSILPAHEFPSSEWEAQLWDLTWVFSVLRRKALLILALACSTTALAAGVLFLIDTTSKPKYAGAFQLQVEAATAEAKSSRSFVSAQSTDRAVEENQGGNVEQNSTLDYETQIRILSSPKLIAPILEQIQRRYPRVTYQSLINDLKIERLKVTKEGKEQGTKLLEISYVADEQQKVLFVLQQISQAYLNYSLKERQSNLRQGIKFIDQQLPQLQERVNTTQRQIEALRQQTHSFDPERQAVESAQLLSSLKRQKFDMLAKSAEAQARYRTLQQQLKGNNAIAILSEYPSTQKLVERYQELKTQIAVTSARFNDDNPSLQSLRDEEKKLKELFDKEADKILTRVADQIEIATKQQQAILQAENNLNQSFQQLPEFARKYSLLNRELKIASETLDRYLSKREAVRIDAAQQYIPWEMLGSPTLKRDLTGQPVNLAKHNKLLLVSLIAILAMLLAVAIAFLIEILQDILYTPREVQQSSELPVLAAISLPNRANSLKLIPTSSLEILSGVPASTKELPDPNSDATFPLSHQDFSGLLLRPSTTELLTESFNKLYSNISISNARPHVRAVAISASAYHQGNSMVAIYLAKAAASVGKRVLLVDADLRAPQLHTYLNLDNSSGLSDSIVSKLDVHQFIQPAFVEKNLFALVAGKAVPSNPVTLLSSSTMKSLMHKFAAEFDLVIYTTPPVNFSDLIWIGSQVDGVIIAAKLGKITRTVLAQAIESLKISQIPILGIVTI